MIGLCAQSRMGKDSVADIILETKTTYAKKAFASELKRVISQYFDIDMNDIEEYKTQSQRHPSLELSMRDTLQLVGETFRKVHPDVWVNAALRNISGQSVIFTDVRHENEMDAILSKKGYLVLIGRPAYLNMDAHPSESGLKDAIAWFLTNTTEGIVVTSELKNLPEEYEKFSVFLRNDNDLEELRKRVIHLLKIIDAKESSIFPNSF